MYYTLTSQEVFTDRFEFLKVYFKVHCGVYQLLTEQQYIYVKTSARLPSRRDDLLAVPVGVGLFLSLPLPGGHLG